MRRDLFFGVTVRWFGTVFVVLLSLQRVEPRTVRAADTTSIRVPFGFTVEEVAGQPLVDYPMMACFDDRGRLFVAEGTGKNVPGTELVKLKLGKITLLEDTDGDGRFDRSNTFVDELVFPQGVLWHEGALYAASHPNIWRFEDTDGDGRADRQEVLAGQFGFNGNGCDIHGPFAGPDGWIYWTDGRHGYKVTTCNGEVLEGLASRIWRCRPDGTGMERICGGGFDNPVEIVFLPDGEIIGTMDQGPGDALLHYVEGAVFPREHPSIEEFPMTGPLLASVYQYSGVLPVALSGLARYRSVQFGPEYRDTLFSAQFNVHRIEQHQLSRNGATFRAENRVFLESRDYDFHPTDVLEDADGSLLIVDMGAWYNYGCPTSKIAKPEVKGSILRVRRSDALQITDPWGNRLPWKSMLAGELIELLKDLRPHVRDRAVDQLVRLGDRAVEPLASVSRRDGARAAGELLPVSLRRDALWALTRIGVPEAKAAIRESLADSDLTVRMVAAHCVGLERDGAGFEQLAKMVVEDEPPLRLKAAEALGRLGQSKAVPALLESTRRGVSGRFLEHALIYALIRIADRDATLAALGDPNPRVSRAALIALDQMNAGDLTRELVAPLLDTDDPDLRQTALDVISRHEGWSDEIIALLDQLLQRPDQLSAETERSLTGALLEFCGEAKVQQLVANAIGRIETPLEVRKLLLGIVARCSLPSLPAVWSAALQSMLEGSDAQLLREAVAVVRARSLRDFDGQLDRLSRRDDMPAELRVAALEALAAGKRRVDADQFKLLLGALSEDAAPLLRVTAARTLGALTLSSEQLIQLTSDVAAGGPLTALLLTPAFVQSRDAKVGLALVAALDESSGAHALTADELRGLLKNYPADVHQAAVPLLGQLEARQQGQEDYLAEVTGRTLQAQGNAERGREVFFSKKVGCYGCHRLGGLGGSAGPDLSQIGRIRWPRDLLEAIVFPSSTIIPDYRTFTIATHDGQVLNGMIVRENSDALFLRTSQLAEIRVARRDVDVIRPSNVSIMPEGLEKTMTSQEFADLLEFLYQQR